ncbi:MAG: glutamate racemase [Candidatus Nitrotoga sp.]
MTTSPQAQSAIGVFDSGVGGLSVLREIRRALPNEDLFYVADTRHAPYGDRQDEFIKDRAATIVQFLLSQQVKAIVVACNTATAVAIQNLRSRFNITLVAIEPAVKPATEITRSGVIGVLATRQTLESERFSALVEKHGGGVEILLQACPGLVEQVEAAQLDGRETHALVARYVSPLLARGADTLVLGCTHYPFLNSIIKNIAGPAVTLIDPAAAVARELSRRLASEQLLTQNLAPGTERFWSSGAAEQVAPIISKLWEKPALVTEMQLLTSPQ